MKALKKYRTRTAAVVASVAAAFTLASCEQILETTPKGALNEQTFYQTDSDFHAAVLGVYSTLLNYAWEQFGTGMFQGTYLPSDELRCRETGAPGCNDDQFLWNEGNGNFAQLWRESYKGIMRANMLLGNLPEAPNVSDEWRPRFEAETRFLRAYFYFYLVRHFADPGRASIPVVTDAAQSLDEAYSGPAETSAVWDLIESDLVFAAENMVETWRGTDQLGRADRYSAYALLGKVRIYRAQWLNEPGKYQEAIQALEAVRQSGRFQLVDDYGENFLESHQNNNESIFEVQMSEGSDLNGWDPVDSGFGSASYSRDIAWGPGCYQGNCEPWGGGRSYGVLHVTFTLQNLFAEQSVTVGGVEYEDPRRYYTLLQDGERLYADPDDWIPMFQAAWSPTGSTPAKYIRPMVLDTYSLSPVRQHVNDYNNDRLIRYADVLLLLAEAYLLGPNNVPEATALINEVRARARRTFEIMHGEPTPAGLVADIPSATFDLLHRERRLELAIEGHRYDDLVRWHRAGLINIPTDVDFGYDVPNGNWQEVHLLKPIPRQELDRNPNLTQHAGY